MTNVAASAGSPASTRETPPSGLRRAGMHAVAKTVASRVGWIVINAMTGVITARALGAAGRGALAAMIMWPVFLAGVLTFGLPSALIFRLRAAAAEERKRLFTTATILAATIGIVASIGGFFLVPWWLSQYSAQVIHWTQLLIVFTIVSILTLIFRAAFESVGNFGRSASSWILSPVQTLASLLILWRLHALTEITAALCYVLAGIPVLAWMFLRLHRLIGWDLSHFRMSARTLLSYGLRAYGIDLCGMLSQSVDQALVVGIISAAEMGQYVVALSLSRTLNAVYQAVSSVIFPKCVGLPIKQAVHTTARLTVLSTVVVLPAALILSFFGSALLHLFYGSEYVVATTLLRFLTAEAILSGVITLLSQPFMAIGRPGTVTLLQVIGLATTIPLLLVLVPRLGTLGAGIALLCSAALRLLLLLASYVRLIGRFPRSADLHFLVQGLSPSALKSLLPSMLRRERLAE